MQPASLSGLSERDIGDVLRHAVRLDRALRGARIVITGATGWFGTWLLDALVALDRHGDLGLRIVAVSRSPDSFARKHPALHAAGQIEWVKADVRDVDVTGTVTHVIHAATDTSTSPDGADDLFDTIVGGTRTMLQLASRHPGAKLLLVGSGAVYGPQPPGIARLSEEHTGAPSPLADPYAEGKRVAEALATTWHASHGVHATIARCFAFVGPHMPFDAHFAIGNFIRDARVDAAIRVRGNGLPRRSYLYMSDLVVWLLTILVEGRALRPYNVGGDEALTIAALARKVADLAGRPTTVSCANEAGAGRDYVPDTTRFIEELEVSSQVRLDDAIRRTFTWFDGLRATTAAHRAIEMAGHAR